ncbi:nicotinate-nucleotide adenylyltransferase [Tissierella sp. Yu-01]|uniref:nicotinate-nucleotide adenylyltransferase n=1 Tax=Tissierella sp. Yu-01 TaxID=3035694 RepID=UPI00240D0C59|nr:nicotinate-nucleotide adenylyltransferase [Tissierella sp. Yu-01]WFA09504.1 nicotinate-nucleotide adenylyltransferase [Tissierella sp. Yu-01]
MKVGLMGGTYNPIHLGHLIISENIRTNFPLDRVIFIPTGDPPHKDNNELISAIDRYNMTKLAIESNPYFDISSIEVKREGKSYSTDTIDEFLKAMPEDELYFIIGSDTLFDLEKWKDIRDIFKKISFIVTGREGLSDNNIEDKIEEYRKKFNSKIAHVSGPKIEISSTMIREYVSEDKSIRYLVPRQVEEYIKTHRLYIVEE